MALTLVHLILFALFPLALAYAALSDLLTLTIPNALVLGIIAAFVVLAPMVGMSWQDFGTHFAAGAAVLILGFACFAFGWIGGGDAKLAASIALFLGAGETLGFVAMASVFGGILTIALLGFRTVPVPDMIIRQPWVQRLHSANTGVPYGIALAAAAAVIYPQSVWVQLIAG
jgi:prepilin peptidase CpaA